MGFEPTVKEAPTTVFETVPFNRSGTSPNGEGEYTLLFRRCHVVSGSFGGSPRGEKGLQQPLGVTGQDAAPDLHSTFPGLLAQVGGAA